MLDIYACRLPFDGNTAVLDVYAYVIRSLRSLKLRDASPLTQIDKHVSQAATGLAYWMWCNSRTSLVSILGHRCSLGLSNLHAAAQCPRLSTLSACHMPCATCQLRGAHKL